MLVTGQRVALFMRPFHMRVRELGFLGLRIKVFFCKSSTRHKLLLSIYLYVKADILHSDDELFLVNNIFSIKNQYFVLP